MPVLFSMPHTGQNLIKQSIVRLSDTFTSCSSEEFSAAYHELWDTSVMKSTLHNVDADKHLSHFNSTCASIQDTIGPLKLKKHKPGPVPWHNDTKCSLSQACRQAEHKWKKDKLQVYYEIMQNSLTMFQRASNAVKCK